MQPSEPEPVPAATDLIEITYVCGTCGTATQRMIKKDERT
jgi:hypothetical protein